MDCSHSGIVRSVKIDAETKEEIYDDLVNDNQPNKFELLVLQRKQDVLRERTTHPIVRNFIEHGPLTPIYNKYWETISGTVIFPPAPVISSCNDNIYDVLPSTSDATSTLKRNVTTPSVCIHISDSMNNPTNLLNNSNLDTFYDDIDNDQCMDETLSLVTTDLKTIASTIDTIFSLEEDSTPKSRMSGKLNDHWFELEKIFYKQIFQFIKLIEKNKSLTKEKVLNPEEWKEMKQKCKNLA